MMYTIPEEIVMGMLSSMYLAMDGVGQASFGSCQIFVLGHCTFHNNGDICQAFGHWYFGHFFAAKDGKNLDIAE